MILHKYLHPDRIDVVTGGRIRFTQPSALNDPFELRPNIEVAKEALIDRRLNDPNFHMDAYIRHVADRNPFDLRVSFTEFKEAISSTYKELAIKSVEDLFNKILPELYDHNFLILSLGGRQDSGLMWSHYAADHKGFVIGFDRDKLVKGLRNKMVGTRIEAYEVRYEENRFILPPNFDEILALVRNTNKSKRTHKAIMSIYSDLMMKTVLTKSRDWAYEKEHRIFTSSRHAAESRPLPDGSTMHLFEFPPDSVVEVVFGHRCHPNDKGALRKEVSTHYPKACLKQASLSPTTFDMVIGPA